MTDEARYLMDPVRFARERLDFSPVAAQAVVLDPSIPRGILNCSRQFGKSTVTALKAVHWGWFRKKSNIVVIAPTEKQAGEFVRKAREFTERLGVRAHGDGFNRISLALPNGSRIVGLAGGGKVRGFSAVSLLLVDEAAEVPEDAYKTARPLMAAGGGTWGRSGHLWLMSTPEGKRGFFYDTWVNGGPEWTRISVKGSECPWISPEFLAEEQATMGDRWFRQEYCCEFVSTHANLFSEDDIQGCISKDIPPLWD